MGGLSFQPRSQRALWAIGAAILFFLILAGWGQLYTELQDQDFTLPIDITVEGVPA